MNRSADLRSAALACAQVQPTVQGFKARSLVSGNSLPDLLPTRCDGATARRVRWGEGMLPGAFIRVWLHRKPVNLQFWSRKAFGVEV